MTPYTKEARVRGSVIVYVAFLLPVIALLVAIALNVGTLVSARSQAQSAVDAAALSAVAGLPRYNLTSDKAAVITLAQAFNGSAQANDANTVLNGDLQINASDIEYKEYSTGQLKDATSAQQTNAVQVSKEFTVPMFLKGIVRKSDWKIRLSATAVLGGPGCMTPALPFALIDCSNTHSGSGVCSSLNCNKEVNLVISNPTQADSAAFFTFDGSPSNASACKSMVEDPEENKFICAGSKIELNNGTIASCLADVAQQCTARNCSPANPWVVNLPVIDCEQLSATGSNPVQSALVSGFARVGINSVSNQGSSKSIGMVLLCGVQSNVAVGGGKNCGTYALGPILVE